MCVIITIIMYTDMEEQRPLLMDHDESITHRNHEHLTNDSVTINIISNEVYYLYYYIYIYIYISAASDIQAVGHRFEPRLDH